MPWLEAFEAGAGGVRVEVEGAGEAGQRLFAVGHQLGYDSSSQFNREYRRQFGLPPGRDAARLRDVAS